MIVHVAFPVSSSCVLKLFVKTQMYILISRDRRQVCENGGNNMLNITIYRWKNTVIAGYTSSLLPIYIHYKE